MICMFVCVFCVCIFSGVFICMQCVSCTFPQPGTNDIQLMEDRPEPSSRESLSYQAPSVPRPSLSRSSVTQPPQNTSRQKTAPNQGVKREPNSCPVHGESGKYFSSEEK